MNAIQIGWVLAAEDSARLATFYRELFQATLKPGVAEHHCIVQFSDGTQLEIYRPSRRRSFPARGERWRPVCGSRHHRSPSLNFSDCSVTPCSVVDRFSRRRGLSPLVLRPGSMIRRAILCCCWLRWPLPPRFHDHVHPEGLQFLHSL